MSLQRSVSSYSGHGPRVGPYVLCRELGSGGMATVYLASADTGRSLVALKVIHAHLSQDANFVAMFRDEAAIASRIRHGNVCRVLDVGTSEERHYIAMEFLAGESLAAVWRRLSDPDVMRLSAARLAQFVGRILSDACEGLHAAHELTSVSGEPLRVVHRDVSPENVMLTYEGSAKLLDFGVATAARQQHRTSTGVLKGKFSYIAPEVLSGSKADRRADVWGMGAIAWELLTSRRLFHGASDLDSLHAITALEIKPPSELVVGIPPAMDEVVLRALSRDPDARQASAREFGTALLRASAKDAEVASLGDVAEWVQSLFPNRPEQVPVPPDCVLSPRSRPTRPEPVAASTGFLSSAELEEDGPTRFVKATDPTGGALAASVRRYVPVVLALAAGLCLGNLQYSSVMPSLLGADLGTSAAAPPKAGAPARAPVVDAPTGASFVSIEQSDDRLILRIDGRTVEILRPSAAAVAPANPPPTKPADGAKEVAVPVAGR